MVSPSGKINFLQEIKNNSLKCNLFSGKHPIPSGARKFVDKMRNSLQENFISFRNPIHHAFLQEK